MSKVDDLTILLKMKDKTGGAFKSLNKRFGALEGLAGKLAKGFAAVGAAAVSGFAAAVVSGQQFVSELNLMSTALGIGKREADALYQVLKESNPAAEIDKVKEGVLTLTEAFFDARAESGPLFDLMKDFGADINFNVEGPREQLAEFLRVMRQIPDETVRVGGAISVLGGDDAKAFLPLIRNVELLDERIGQLTGSIEDIPNIFSEEDIKALERAKLATDELDAEWENFGKTASVIVAPAIETTNRLFAEFIRGARQGLRDFLGELGIVENRDRITQINDELKESSQLIENLQGSISKRESFESGMFSSQNEKIIANQKARVTELTNGVSDLRLELKALTTDSTLPSVIEESTSNVSSIVEARVKKEKTVRERVNAALAETAFDLPGQSTDLNGAIDVQKLGESYQVTSEQLKLFTADTDRAKAANQAFHSVLGSASSVVGSLGDAFAKTKKQAKIFVAIQEVLAVVSAYSAATQALASATAPDPFTKFAAYASVLARGLAGVAAVKRAGSRIGASGGSSSSAASTASTTASSTSVNTQAPAANQPQNNTGPNVTIQLSGNGRYGSDEVIELFEEMKRLGVLGNVDFAA